MSDDLVTVPAGSPRVVTTDPRKRVLIVMPWYKSCSPLTAFSVMGLIDRSRTALLLNFGDAFVAHTRNHCVDHFLGSDLDWMLTIDDDMVVPFGNASWFNSYTGFNLPPKFAGLNALDRLLSHGKTLVGALYYGRSPGGKPMFAEGVHQSAVEAEVRRGPRDEARLTKWVGTGCMLIHRNVFLDIEKRFPDLSRRGGKTGGQWFTSSEHELKQRVQVLCKDLEVAVRAGQNMTVAAWERLNAALGVSQANSSLGMGEDVQFCIRAGQAGHPAYVDLGLVCGHVGTRVYGPR